MPFIAATAYFDGALISWLTDVLVESRERERRAVEAGEEQVLVLKSAGGQDPTGGTNTSKALHISSEAARPNAQEHLLSMSIGPDFSGALRP